MSPTSSASEPPAPDQRFQLPAEGPTAADLAAQQDFDARVKASVAIGEREGDPTRFSDLVTPERNLVERLGILGLDLTPSLAGAVGGVRGLGGVLVAARALNTGAEYGLEVADLILSVNGTPVKNLAELRSLVGRLHGQQLTDPRRGRRPRLQILPPRRLRIRTPDLSVPRRHRSPRERSRRRHRAEHRRLDPRRTQQPGDPDRGIGRTTLQARAGPHALHVVRHLDHVHPPMASRS